jgi:hypothetical protein
MSKTKQKEQAEENRPIRCLLPVFISRPDLDFVLRRRLWFDRSGGFTDSDGLKRFRWNLIIKKTTKKNTSSSADL